MCIRDRFMDDSRPICRICLDEDTESNLCDPCDCSGTQRWVHPDCIATWRREIGLPKASRCQVCRAKYSIKLACPKTSPSCWTCKPLHLTFGLLLSVALGTILPIIGIVLVWILSTLRSSLSVARFPDGALGIIRQGDPVPELDVGAMLVATSTMRSGTCFSQSVVLMLDHAPGVGSRGVVLNFQDSPGRVAFRGGDNDIGIGGPVGVNDVWTILHDAGPNIGHSDFIIENVYAVVVHGHHHLVELLQQLASSGARSRVLIGYAGWAPRQLDGEIRCGSWKVVPEATAEDVFCDHDLVGRMRSRVEQTQ
eukprot:TRINITY_DN12612_c0_g1_i1.p1 TRINITY_DN12612_c0_g1~~TRINITY_DN12612_c0_g1_i1.p1  ORF type:complete len:309 (-),score=38.60 TRINITY_DN12612_c0_g1_i1:255-1181(-)